FQRIDDADGEDVVEELGGVIGVARGCSGNLVTSEDGGAGGIAAELDVLRGDERAGGGGEEGLGDVAMDEELFGGVADAGTLGLGVDEDFFRHREIGGAIDVNEADALEVFDDGNRAVVGDETDEALAAAGNDAVDERV